MHLRPLHCLAMMLLCLPATAAMARKSKPCLTADEASRRINKDISLCAHVYEVVQLPDGTRFLDVCSPETPDSQCHFTVISLWEDRDEVGELVKYRGENVRIRGIVRSMRGRAGLELSNVRQFYGGPPRFKPNPRLAHGFDAGQGRPPVADPNLRSQGGRRAFMNSRNQETRPAQ